MTCAPVLQGRHLCGSFFLFIRSSMAIKTCSAEEVTLGQKSQEYLCGSVPSTVSGEEVIKINYLILQLIPWEKLAFSPFYVSIRRLCGSLFTFDRVRKEWKGKEELVAFLVAACSFFKSHSLAIWIHNLQLNLFILYSLYFGKCFSF